MGLGILEDEHLAHVPGTVNLTQTSETSATEPDTKLKYDKTGTIILVPQPSDDHNDPLNWPLWKRDVYLLTLSLLAVIASTLSSLLAANTLTLSLYFGRTFTDVALLTGYHLLGVGIAGFLFVPSARVWGKRHCYIIGTICLIFSSAWAGSTKNCGGQGNDQFCYDGTYYTSLTWARVFQGVGLAPFEALVNASVGDLYFVHERGLRMAVTNLALFGGAFCTPIIVGKMTATLGWDWPFYFVAILCGALFPVVIFFLPETSYRRDDNLNTDIGASEDHRNQDPTSYVSTNKTLNIPNDGNGNDSIAGHRHESASAAPVERTYWRSLTPFNGRKTNEGYLRLLLRPFPLFFHPGVAWAYLIQGVMIGWTVMIGVVLAAIMLGPPLYFDEVETGYLYAGAFIGAVVGFFFSGILADYSVKLMTKWNRGVYEPEFRMVLVIPQTVCGVVGLLCFGWTSNNTFRYGWFPSCFFFGMQVAGMVFGAVSSSLYIVDAHRDIAIEAFTCLLVFKNIFSFGLTYDSYNWLVQSGQEGIWKVFRIIGGVQIAVCALTIPIYVLGKRNRSFWARHPVFFQASDAIADLPKKFFRTIFKNEPRNIL
ncbi:MFS transporter-like protein [Pseudovirgaria hyperparasitica]|uniref:MFS transporter-like protein n=1 Tax=Pseudovirgaria hyperparasitica TaxID=470096 RepID=A0A6A6VTI6_9PEZI|nr:MFS transporter-like protein [Pseudovirgaria hyperparasitica]KAF2752910.1 MFS transporter-like protein [Pseudovirgaria hyperparasitica]